MLNDLHRTNINFYRRDIEFLKRKYGSGWSELIREQVHKWIEKMRDGNEQG